LHGVAIVFPHFHLSEGGDGRNLGSGGIRQPMRDSVSEDVDHLLRGRLKVLKLDVDAIARDFPELFSRVKINCPLCGDRQTCVLDLQNDPSTLGLEADCPNAEVLNIIAALAELNN
jgi:hypothetical protein